MKYFNIDEVSTMVEFEAGAQVGEFKEKINDGKSD